MTQQYTCSVYSGDVAINFLSSVDLYSLFSRKSYTRSFPEFICEREAAASHFAVKYEDCDDSYLKYEEHIVSVHFPWRQMREGETILYLGYPYLEYQRQLNGELTCHAASFAYNGKGYMLLGKEGSGKTTTVIRLCRDKRCYLVSNDLCLIKHDGQDTYLLGGTRFFFVRKASMQRSLPELLSHFKESELDPWRDKVVVEADQLGIQKQKTSVPLRGVFIVHIDETQESVYINKIDDLVTRLFLNENFSRYIRSTCTTMLGGERYDILGYIPSLDNRSLFERRKALINHMIYDVGIYYISGKSEDITETICDWIANESK